MIDMETTSQSLAFVGQRIDQLNAENAQMRNVLTLLLATDIGDLDGLRDVHRDAEAALDLPPSCARHGTPFISPGICPFCDERAVVGAVA